MLLMYGTHVFDENIYRYTTNQSHFPLVSFCWHCCCWFIDDLSTVPKRLLIAQVEGSEIRTRQYTDVNVHQTERIRPYFAVLHGSILRSFFSVSYTTVYRSFTIEDDLSNMSFRAVNDVCMQKCTENIYNDDKQTFSCAHRWPYFIVNDTEEYSRNTEPCNTECYGKIRSRRPY